MLKVQGQITANLALQQFTITQLNKYLILLKKDRFWWVLWMETFEKVQGQTTANLALQQFIIIQLNKHLILLKKIVCGEFCEWKHLHFIIQANAHFSP